MSFLPYTYLFIFRTSSRTKNKTSNYDDSLTQKHTGDNESEESESEADDDDFKDVSENEDSDEDISDEENHQQLDPQEEDPEDPPTPPYQKKGRKTPKTNRTSRTLPRKTRLGKNGNSDSFIVENQDDSDRAAVMKNILNKMTILPLRYIST
jgi:hypothetical protein